MDPSERLVIDSIVSNLRGSETDSYETLQWKIRVIEVMLHTMLEHDEGQPLRNCGFHDHNMPCDCDLC